MTKTAAKAKTKMTDGPVKTNGAEMTNGVDVRKLFETVGAIKQTPNLAVFKFRLNNRWIDGGFNRSTVNPRHGICLRPGCDCHEFRETPEKAA